MNETPEAKPSELSPLTSGNATQKRGRGPDKKPRKRSTRSDNPARYLPSTADAHRIAKEQGKTVGRPRGSRNGWTRAERELNWEVAQAKAKLEVAFYYEVGYWPSLEQRERLYLTIDRELRARWMAMLEKRRAAKMVAEKSVEQSA